MDKFGVRRLAAVAFVAGFVGCVYGLLVDGDFTGPALLVAGALAALALSS